MHKTSYLLFFKENNDGVLVGKYMNMYYKFILFCKFKILCNIKISEY